MSKKEKEPKPQAQDEQVAPVEPVEPADGQTQSVEQPPVDEAQQLRDQLAQKEDQYLRLAAEYDNYRKRTVREKDSIWTDARAETAQAFLPVYDNLERAIRQPTADEAFKKGVEMTMAQLKEVFARLGIEEIPALGQAFDPNVHNAVMHVEDEKFGENEVAEVLQTGFRCGDKVIRCAMVKVAN